MSGQETNGLADIPQLRRPVGTRRSGSFTWGKDVKVESRTEGQVFMASCWTGQETNAFILNCVKEISNSINKNAPWKEGRKSRCWPGCGLRRDYLSLMANLLTATPIDTSNVTVGPSAQHAHRRVLPLPFAGFISPVVSWLADLWRYIRLWNPEIHEADRRRHCRRRPRLPLGSVCSRRMLKTNRTLRFHELQEDGGGRKKKSPFLLHFAWICLNDSQHIKQDCWTNSSQ